MALFNDGVIPIQIRDDVTVGVAHLPPDLSKEEAERVSRIIIAHAITQSNVAQPTQKGE